MQGQEANFFFADNSAGCGSGGGGGCVGGYGGGGGGGGSKTIKCRYQHQQLVPTQRTEISISMLLINNS